MLEIGDILPELTLTDDEGNDYQLDVRKEYLIVYFYSKNGSSGCLNEAVSFNAEVEQFDSLNTEIIGISRDSANSHKQFKQKHSIGFKLLSDEALTAATAFGTLNIKTKEGKQTISVSRTTFIFRKNKRNENEIIMVFNNVKAANHGKEVLEYLKNGLSR